jgi:hypothetical protein
VLKGFKLFSPAKRGSTAANGLPARGYYLRYDAYYKLHTPATLLSIQSTAVDCGLSQSLTPADWIGLDFDGPPEVRTTSDRASRSDPVCSPGRTVRNTAAFIPLMLHLGSWDLDTSFFTPLLTIRSPPCWHLRLLWSRYIAWIALWVCCRLTIVTESSRLREK